MTRPRARTTLREVGMAPRYSQTRNQYHNRAQPHACLFKYIVYSKFQGFFVVIKNQVEVILVVFELIESHMHSIGV
jgi:hypothetical protein